MQTHSSVSSRPFVQSYQESPISLGSIEKNTGNRKSVFLDDQDLTRGFTVIHGGPGSGKSVLARSIALQHLQRGGALLYLNLEGLPALQDALPNVSLSTDSVDGAFSVLPPRALLQRLAPSANQTTAGSHAIDAVLPVFSLTIDIVQARNGIIHVSEICELLQDPQRLEEGIPDLAYKDREIHAHAVDCFRDSETKELCLDRYHQVVDPFVHRLQDLLGNHYDDISGNYASWQNLVSVVLERRSCEASVQDSWAPKRQSFLLSAYSIYPLSYCSRRHIRAGCWFWSSPTRLPKPCRNKWLPGISRCTRDCAARILSANHPISSISLPKHRKPSGFPRVTGKAWISAGTWINRVSHWDLPML